MRIRVVTILTFVALVTTTSASAQTSLTLAEAIERARSQSVEAKLAASGERAAEYAIDEARAGYFPRVDFTESWQRGNQPVFVFGSLLAQRRFTAADFALDRLNHPSPINNWRSAFSLEQLVYDGGATRASVKMASLGRDVARSRRSQADHDLAVAATDAFGRVLLLEAEKRAAAAAVEASAEDLGRARNRRAVGLATDADVLSLEVHVARVRERQIRAESEEQVARGRLNQVIGAALDAVFTLAPTPDLSATAGSGEALEQEALERRPEVQLAKFEQQMAEAGTAMARAGFLPQVGAQGAYEWNGESLTDQVSAWTVGAMVRINLFHGFADRARVARAREGVTQKALERERIETNVRLDVRSALARLKAAEAREAAGRAATAQARESQRIIRDRYENGLSDITELLRASEAILTADSQAIAASVDVLVQAAALDRALGR